MARSHWPRPGSPAGKGAAFNIRELRIAAALQVAICCAVIGFAWRDVPADAVPRLLPRFIFGYALVALIAPLMPGTWDHGDLHPVSVLIHGVMVALPMALLSRAMADTPYTLMAATARVIAWTWAGWFVVASVYWVGWGRKREAARLPSRH